MWDALGKSLVDILVRATPMGVIGLAFIALICVAIAAGVAVWFYFRLSKKADQFYTDLKERDRRIIDLETRLNRSQDSYQRVVSDLDLARQECQFKSAEMQQVLFSLLHLIPATLPVITQREDQQSQNTPGSNRS